VNARSRITALLFGGALVSALLGQLYFARRREYLWDGIVFYIVAVILFLALVRRMEGHPALAGLRGAISWAPWAAASSPWGSSGAIAGRPATGMSSLSGWRAASSSWGPSWRPMVAGPI
jgi:hypothetical protein